MDNKKPFTVTKKCTYKNVKEDMYSISSDGDIYNTINNKKLTNYIDSRGYLSVTLKSSDNYNSNCVPCKVHGLVANEFLGDRPTGMVINHIDGDKLNPTLSNIEYCTQSENVLHAMRMGLTNILGENNSQNKFSEQLVLEICMYMAKGYSDKEICSFYKINSRTNRSLYDLIKKIRHRKNWNYISKFFRY